jgi:hypothetical protein
MRKHKTQGSLCVAKDRIEMREDSQASEHDIEETFAAIKCHRGMLREKAPRGFHNRLKWSILHRAE